MVFENISLSHILVSLRSQIYKVNRTPKSIEHQRSNTGTPRVRLEDVVGTSCLQSPRVSVAGSSVSSRRNDRPKLYQWCASSSKWDSLYSYEDDDLSSNGLFILDGEKSSFVWCGKQFPIRDEEKLQSIVNSFVPDSSNSSTQSCSSIPRVFVHETEESDEFWELFEDGF